MKQKVRDLIESVLVDFNEKDKWFFHAMYYADWLDKAEDGITKEEALELLGSISSCISDTDFADKVMNFVHENKNK